MIEVDEHNKPNHIHKHDHSHSNNEHDHEHKHEHKCKHNHNHDHKHKNEHKHSHNDSSEEEINLNVNLDKHNHSINDEFSTNNTIPDSRLDFYSIINNSVKLAKTNNEFFTIITLLITWLIMVLFEFFYGFIELKVDIISDSFFNFFKSFSFLIAATSLLLNRIFIFSNNKVFVNRIELIGALSNLIFLIIVAMYMSLQALHLITEDETEKLTTDIESEEQINFFKRFFLVKIIINSIALLQFSDYILHPIQQMQFALYKSTKKWLTIADFTETDIYSSKSIIANYNSHSLNMHALTINMISDLISSIVFIVCFYGDFNFEVVYLINSFINLGIIFYISKPLINSSIEIFMQANNSITIILAKKLKTDINYIDGVTAIKNLKIYMIQPNEIVINIKLYSEKPIEKVNIALLCESIFKRAAIQYNLNIDVII